jgi:multidrug resistance efflux pump
VTAPRWLFRLRRAGVVTKLATVVGAVVLAGAGLVAAVYLSAFWMGYR